MQHQTVSSKATLRAGGGYFGRLQRKGNNYHYLYLCCIFEGDGECCFQSPRTQPVHHSFDGNSLASTVRPSDYYRERHAEIVALQRVAGILHLEPFHPLAN